MWKVSNELSLRPSAYVQKTFIAVFVLFYCTSVEELLSGFNNSVYPENLELFQE